MGFALQGFDPFTKPSTAHHRRITLLPLLPPVAQPQVLGLRFLWACDPLPRMVGIAPFIDFRVLVLVKVSQLVEVPLEIPS